MSSVEQLVLQAKTCFQTKDYETCMSLTDEALRMEPGHTEACWLMKEAQRQWEDQRSLEQLEIYVENLKKEAMDLFDKEQFEQCLGMFRFLSELEPENHTLRDYVKLSQQMFVETIGSQEPTFVRPDRDSQPQIEAFQLAYGAPEAAGSDPLIPHEDQERSTQPSPVAEPETGPPQSMPTPTEVVPHHVTQKIAKEYIALVKVSRRRRNWNVGLALALLLLMGLMAGAFWLRLPFLKSRIEIESIPEGATVYLDDGQIGETPLRQRNISAGSHVLRIEKQGYQTYNRKLDVEPARAILLAVQLEKWKSVATASLPPVQSLPPQNQPLTPTPAVSDLPQAEASVVQLAQSVIHHHLLGSCTGRLKIEGDRISFWSSGNAQDGFTRKIRQITRIELTEKLVIEFKDKTYRFEALARDPKENQKRLMLFYEQIRSQKEPRKPL